MARVVSQKMQMCNNCGCQTLHQKNSKQMSWGMHIFLTIITLGVWFLFWLFMLIWHAFAKPLTAVTNRWRCSKCGN